MANTAHDRAAKEVADLRLETETYIQKWVHSNLEPAQTHLGLGD
jgi:hypothetical protein